MKVYIGTGPRYEQITRILHRSILRWASRPVEVRYMEAWAEPAFSDWHGQPTEENFGRLRGGWVTPFSLFRYAIPYLQGYEGFAVYLDADMIVTGDIWELASYAMAGRWVAAKNRDGDCVQVIDCSALELDLDALKGGVLGDKRRLRHKVEPITRRLIPEVWNDTDRYRPGVSKLVHYTSMKTQPWQPYPEVIDYEPHPDPNALGLYNWERMRDEREAGGSPYG
jgi:hypothetical protein